MTDGAILYRLGLSPGAQRSLSGGRIPEGVALAVVELMTATIAECQVPGLVESGF